MRKNVSLVAFAMVILVSVLMGVMVNVVQADVHTSIYIRHTYTFTIGPGGNWSTDSVLHDDVWGMCSGHGEADKYVMTVTERSFVTVEVEDCCLMGDTIALGTSALRYWKATSPDTVVVSGWLDPGIYTFYVGYTFLIATCTVGYDTYVWGS